MRIAVVIESLKKKESAKILPITTLDGEVILTKKYPTNAQIAEWLNVKEEELTVKK